MKILGIDTSTKFFCLAISDGKKIYAYNLKLEKRQAALLIPTLKRVVASLNWQMSDFDYFACGLGPGSFTGIRVGVATIKGLCWALKKPAVGIPTLDILAENAANYSGDIVAIVDAKRNLIYAGIYRKRNGRLRRIWPYLLLDPIALCKKTKAGSVFLGDAIGLYREIILKNVKGAVILDKDCWYLRPQQLIKLAEEQIRQKKINNAFNLKPLYLYPKECQIRER